jgi:hypothetical protein
LGDTFIDPGVSISDNLNDSLIPIITGTVNTNVIGTYNLSYIAKDNSNNFTNTLYRTVNVYSYPSISNLNFVSNIISFIVNGYYSILSYKITQLSNIIINEIVLSNYNIDISSLTLSSVPYLINIYLKRSSNDILITNTIAITNSNFGPMINRIGPNPLLINLSSTYNIFANISAVNLPSYSNINISSSNIDIINNLNQQIITPSNGILPINYGNIFTITYNITGNNNINVSTTIVTQIIDNIPPSLILLGSNPMNILLYSQFNDPGYTVTDNSGQTITPLITGFVNSYLAGTYTLKYTATDNNNNSTSIIRTIIVS